MAKSASNPVIISAKQSQVDQLVKPFRKDWIDSRDTRCCKTYNKFIDLRGNLTHFSYRPYKGFKVNRWLYGGDYLPNKGRLGCSHSKSTSLAGGREEETNLQEFWWKKAFWVNLSQQESWYLNIQVAVFENFDL